MVQLLRSIAAITALWLALAATPALAQPSKPAPLTILISIDGFRADLLDPELAPHIAALGKAGVRFANAEVGFPSDSMPGILGPLTGASPRGTGIPYDEYYDRHYKLAIEITETVTVPPGLKPHDLLEVAQSRHPHVPVAPQRRGQPSRRYSRRAASFARCDYPRTDQAG